MPRTSLPSAAELAALPPDTFSAARIVRARPKLECVAYVRRETGIAISGDAWTWWDHAAGRYARGSAPQPGSILVFKRYNGSAGHVAVVRSIANPRIIVVDHADWLNDGNIHKSTPVLDVSEKGDWSQIRVWYSPGHVWGARIYGAYGFIYLAPRVADRLGPSQDRG